MAAEKHFKPGIDGVTASQNRDNLLLNGETIVKSLSGGSYHPLPALSFAIVGKNGKTRELSRFSALDIVIQRALASELSQGLDGTFSKNSFAFIKGRGIHDAAARFCELAGKHPFAAKIDPKSCFDNIDRDILFNKVPQFVDNPDFISLIKLFAECGTADEKGVHFSPKGILQGSPLSPVLCNVYFHGLDMLLESHDIDFIRYADDTVVFADSIGEINRLAEIVTDYLVNELKLEINDKKLRIGKSEDIEFLGFMFLKTSDGDIIVVEKTASSHDQYTKDWTSNRFLSGQNKVSIFSDGILSRKETAFLFESDEKTLLPPGVIKQLNVFSSVTFSPNVIKAAFDNGIRINIFDRFGNKLGSFEPESGFANSQIPIKQLEIYRKTKTMRMNYARDFVLSRNHNIRLNLRYQRKNYGGVKCAEVYDRLNAMNNEVKKCKTIEDLLLIEARMQEAYFSCFDEIIRNPEFEFKKRTRRPPKNAVNAMLSFGNTFLYNHIATEINMTPLDIRIAYLHSTNKRRESLNLDIADVYKPLIVDRTVFSLINRRMITPLCFITEKNGGVLLTNNGKKLMVKALNDKLNTSITVGNEQKKYLTIIR
ncbi:MAG: CRISPR-associated endonuclease Cas1, partial [Eubacterium sp.]|nr:CRISPR-associated endonuclease Cas1 [Eubacterium sp.]